MVEIRSITADEIVAFRTAISAGFGADEPARQGGVEGFLANNELGNTIAAFDRGHIVATFGSYNLQMTVPGPATVPMAGTTVVTVHPTHRRRGLLTEMMGRHLRQAIDQGKVMAGLWASEEQIYGRFGYGLAVECLDLRIPNTVGLPPGPADVTIRPATTDEARTALPPIYGRFQARTPGSFLRWDGWWDERHFHDAPHRRPSGATARRHVVAERDGDDVGYAVYRQVDRDPADASGGSVMVVELIADDDDVRRALWYFLTNVDLFPNATWWNAPVDDPVVIEADKHRAITASRGDTLWARPLDVSATIEGRRYERDGVLTIGVTDPFLDRRLVVTVEVADGEAHCTERPAGVGGGPEPTVHLDIADLGALSFGGRSARQLARARRIEGDPRSIVLLDDLFRTGAAPFCSEVF